MSSGSTLGNGTTLHEVQMKEAQAELQLLQCWGGEDQPDRMDLDNPFKRLSNLDEEGEEEKGRDPKWPRPDSKGGFNGRGGQGKDNRSGAQPTKSQPPKSSAPRRFTQDRQGKDLEGMLLLLGKLLLRHKDQTGIDRTENNFVMFYKRESALSLVPLFVNEEGPALACAEGAKTGEDGRHCASASNLPLSLDVGCHAAAASGHCQEPRAAEDGHDPPGFPTERGGGRAADPFPPVRLGDQDPCTADGSTGHSGVRHDREDPGNAEDVSLPARSSEVSLDAEASRSTARPNHPFPPTGGTQNSGDYGAVSTPADAYPFRDLATRRRLSPTRAHVPVGTGHRVGPQRWPNAFKGRVLGSPAPSH